MDAQPKHAAFGLEKSVDKRRVLLISFLLGIFLFVMVPLGARGADSETAPQRRSHGAVEARHLVDLRVDDHPHPITELRRLWQLSRVYHLIDESEDMITRGDLENALTTIRKALSMNSSIDDAHINLAIILLKLGRTEEALLEFTEAIHINPKARRLIRRLAHSGRIPCDRKFLTRLELAKENT